MKFFTLQEILEKELKDPKFKAGFEAEKRVMAAERAQLTRMGKSTMCAAMTTDFKTASTEMIK